MDKVSIAQGIFYDSFKVYLAFNSINLIYLFIRLIIDKFKNKRTLYSRIIYLITIPVFGLWFSNFCTKLIDYDDAFLSEGIGWTFLLKIIPLIIIITIINFIVLKCLGKIKNTKTKDIQKDT